MRWQLREQEKLEQEAEKKQKEYIAPIPYLTEKELIQKEKVISFILIYFLFYKKNICKYYNSFINDIIILFKFSILYVSN